jgi:uncharacterized protein with HEPN domain
LPFDSPASAFRDLAEAIDDIQQFTEVMDLEVFRQDLKTIAAVERKLLVISEAAIRLKDDASRLCPDVPWPEIRGIGNWLRHRYDRVDLETLWNTVQDDLPPHRGSVARVVESRPQAASCARRRRCRLTPATSVSARSTSM